MQPSTEFLIGFVTAPDLETARALSRAALESRCVACANLIPQIESHYWWQGKIEIAAEVMIVFKTIRSKVDDFEKCIRANHPYQVPEIVLLPISSGHPPYLNWIMESVSPS